MEQLWRMSFVFFFSPSLCPWAFSVCCSFWRRKKILFTIPPLPFKIFCLISQRDLNEFTVSSVFHWQRKAEQERFLLFCFNSIFSLSFVPLSALIILYNSFKQEVAAGERGEWWETKGKEYIFQHRREQYCVKTLVL